MTTTAAGYDPYSHAHELNVDVQYRPLRNSFGIWLPAHRAIIIQPNLPSYVERSILAHEVVHAEYDDPPGWHAKHERRANRIAANRLIDESLMVDLLRTTSDYDAVCIELGVTRELLRTKLTTSKRTTPHGHETMDTRHLVHHPAHPGR